MIVRPVPGSRRLPSRRRIPRTAAGPRRTGTHKCPICWDPFVPGNIMFLPCGHVVHATCLLTFHRFTHERDYTCPVCHVRYNLARTRAETARMQASALAIQRVFRGFVARQHLRVLVKPGSLLHRRWVLARAEQAGTRFASAVEDQSDAVDAILLDIDKELEWARSVMKEAAMRVQDIDWTSLRRSVPPGPCPICLREITSDGSITSCGHCFHEHCLLGWIQHCETRRSGVSCPCCRAPFQHAPLRAPRRSCL